MPLDKCNLCESPLGDAVWASGIRDWEYFSQGEWRYVRCDLCQNLSLRPSPTDASLQEAYPETYHAYRRSSDGNWLFYFMSKVRDHIARRKLLNQIRRLRGRSQNILLLDVGCGRGDLLKSLRSDSWIDSYGIDFSPDAVKEAELDGLENVVQGELLTAISPAQRFDVILMNNYLEHARRPLEELRFCFSLLKDGGFIWGELPNYQSIDAAVFKSAWGGGHAPRHLSQFCAEGLKRIAYTVGFSQVEVMHQANPGHLALSIQNKLVELGILKIDSIKFGRARFYPLLLLAMMPVSIIEALIKRSGVIKFKLEK